MSRPAALRRRPQRGPGAPHASARGVCAAVPWGRRDWGLAARGWDSCCAHRPRISPDPGTPQALCTPRPRSPWGPPSPTNLGTLVPRELCAPWDLREPREPCCPGVRVPESLRAPCIPPALRRPWVPPLQAASSQRPDLRLSGSQGSSRACPLAARSKKLDAIDCTLRGPKGGPAGPGRPDPPGDLWKATDWKWIPKPLSLPRTRVLSLFRTSTGSADVC